MPEITPEQKEQLNNWSIQRDALLGVIAELKKEEEIKTNKVRELATSATEIENKIQQSIGRLAELDNTEKLYMEIVDSKLPQLENKKTALESQCTSLSIVCDELELVKSKLQKDIEFLTTTYKEVFERTGILREVVEHVTVVNLKNVKYIDDAIELLDKKVKEILSLSDTNIKAHTEILYEIPRLFVELQRKTLVREKL